MSLQVRKQPQSSLSTEQLSDALGGRTVSNNLKKSYGVLLTAATTCSRKIEAVLGATDEQKYNAREAAIQGVKKAFKVGEEQHVTYVKSLRERQAAAKLKRASKEDPNKDKDEDLM